MLCPQYSTALVTVLVFGLLALQAEAGCYKDKSYKRVIPESERYYNHIPVPLKKLHDLPKNFNWCDNEGVNYCTASWNQHIPYYCGSCWVHGTLASIQDRLKIKKQAKGIDVMLSRQTLLNCAALEGYGRGCDGGDTVDVFGYMTKFGLPDESCMLYNATDHNKFRHHKRCPPEGKCTNCFPVDGEEVCWPVKRYVNYYLTSWGQVDKGEEAMMSEIHARGPITCGAACSDDFVWKYRGGIYKDTEHPTRLDHDVEVVGWGEEDGTKFWIVRNSWGTYWGELGFFRVERGVNALQLESGDCWYGVPEFRDEQEIADGEIHGSMDGLVDDDDYAHAMQRMGQQAGVTHEVRAWPEGERKRGEAGRRMDGAGVQQ